MDGIEQFQVQEAPEPVDLGNDEVLVRIRRVSLNNRDIKRERKHCYGVFSDTTNHVQSSMETSRVDMQLRLTAPFQPLTAAAR